MNCPKNFSIFLDLIPNEFNEFKKNIIKAYNNSPESWEIYDGTAVVKTNGISEFLEKLCDKYNLSKNIDIQKERKLFTLLFDNMKEFEYTDIYTISSTYSGILFGIKTGCIDIYSKKPNYYLECEIDKIQEWLALQCKNEWIYYSPPN